MPPVKIHVTKELIDGAIRRSSSACAAADALRAKFPWAKAVLVDIQTIRFSDHRRKAATGKWTRHWYLTPRSIQEYIIKWDEGGDIKPFTFVLKQETRVTKELKSSDKAASPSSDKIVLRSEKNSKASKSDKPTRERDSILVRTETKKTKLPPTHSSGRRTYGLRGLTY